MTQNSSSHLVNLAHVLRCEVKGFMLIAGRKPFITVAKTKYCFYTVVIMKAHYNCPDNVIEPRAQATAGNNTALEPGRIKKYLFAGSGHLQGRKLHAFVKDRVDFPHVCVVDHTFFSSTKGALLIGEGMVHSPSLDTLKFKSLKKTSFLQETNERRTSNVEHRIKTPCPSPQSISPEGRGSKLTPLYPEGEDRVRG